MKYLLLLTLSILLISTISAETTFYQNYVDNFIYSNPAEIPQEQVGGPSGGFYVGPNVTSNVTLLNIKNVTAEKPVIPTDISDKAKSIFMSPYFWIAAVIFLVWLFRKKSNKPKTYY